MSTAMHRTSAAAALLISLSLMAGACGGDASRRDVLADLTDRVIIPRFAAAADWSAALEATAATLISTPSSDSLADARDAWRSARSAWSRTEALWFGPVMERRSRSLVSWWPIDTARIEQTLSERSAITRDDVINRFASTQRGLSALEYLLFLDEPRILAELNDRASLYADYLRTLSAVIAAETAAVHEAWRGDYGDQFAGRGDRAIAASLAVADIVRTSIFLTETIGDMRLGAALGALNGEPEIDAIPGGAAGRALDDLRQGILGMQELYLGSSTGLGLSDLIGQLSAETDQRMRTAFNDAAASIDAISGGLKHAAAHNPAQTAAARDAIKHLQRVLNTEVVSLLGISVGFSDNDGDS